MTNPDQNLDRGQVVKDRAMQVQIQILKVVRKWKYVLSQRAKVIARFFFAIFQEVLSKATLPFA